MRLLIVLLVGALAACSGDAAVGTGTQRAPARPTSPDGGIVAEWREAPPGPLPARDGAVIAWTGDEILVVGGTTALCPPEADCVAPPASAHRRDAAALDPATMKWRVLADAPVPVLAHSAHAEIGGDLFVLVPSSSGSALIELLRYRTASDVWESIAVPTDQPLGSLVPVEGRLVVHSQSDESGPRTDLSFDPELGTWTELPPDPLSPSFDRHLVGVGADLYLFAKELTPSPGGESGPAVTEAAVLRSDGRWEQLPTGEDVLGFWSRIVDGDRIVAFELGCADGGEVNGYGRCIPYGGIFDTATRSWAPLPDGPAGESARSAGAFTDDQVVLVGQFGSVLDVAADRWIDLPGVAGDAPDGGVQRTVAGAGPHGFAFGGVRWDADGGASLLGDAWIWTPGGG